MCWTSWYLFTVFTDLYVPLLEDGLVAVGTGIRQLSCSFWSEPLVQVHTTHAHNVRNTGKVIATIQHSRTSDSGLSQTRAQQNKPYTQQTCLRFQNTNFSLYLQKRGCLIYKDESSWIYVRILFPKCPLKVPKYTVNRRVDLNYVCIWSL